VDRGGLYYNVTVWTKKGMEMEILCSRI